VTPLFGTTQVRAGTQNARPASTLARAARAKALGLKLERTARLLNDGQSPRAKVPEQIQRMPLNQARLGYGH